MTVAWIALSVSLLSLIAFITFSLVSLRRSSPIAKTLDELVKNQNSHAAQLVGLLKDLGSIMDRLQKHEERDDKQYADITKMFGDIIARFDSFLTRPTHEEDEAVTRRELRHERDSTSRVFSAITSQLENMNTGISGRLDTMDQRLGRIENRSK